jgi:hypothetical protein
VTTADLTPARVWTALAMAWHREVLVVLEKRLQGPQAQVVSRGEGSTRGGNGGRRQLGNSRDEGDCGF